MSSNNQRVLREIDNLYAKFHRVREEYKQYSLSDAPNADKNEMRCLRRMDEIEEKISELKRQLEY